VLGNAGIKCSEPVCCYHAMGSIGSPVAWKVSEVVERSTYVQIILESGDGICCMGKPLKIRSSSYRPIAALTVRGRGIEFVTDSSVATTIGEMKFSIVRQ